MPGVFRFSFGPWNLHEGADPFGPKVRDSIPFQRKLAWYRKLGFGGVQMHDDDAVPDLERLAPEQVVRRARAVRAALGRHGLKTEFVAPRLWEDPRYADGAYTSNDPKCRRQAIRRSLLAVDIARELDTDLVVLWLAREGTYIREAKDAAAATGRILEAVNAMLEHDRTIRLAIEPKPNEPMDQAYLPTVGHALALGAASADPARLGVNVESAHAILAGLDPSDEMGFALHFGKLFTVHLNDQNGLKFDEDMTFGAVNLRRAFNQVRLLDAHGYGRRGEWVGLDVKAMRTQRFPAAGHLANSRRIFLRLLAVSRGLSEGRMRRMIADREYEELNAYLVGALMGK